MTCCLCQIEVGSPYAHGPLRFCAACWEDHQRRLARDAHDGQSSLANERARVRQDRAHHWEGRNELLPGKK